MLTNKDYCDYETCVALKELGYKVPTSAYYITNDTTLYFVSNPFRGGYAIDCFYSHNSLREGVVTSNYIDAPTMWETQKWLREEKKIFVDVIFQGVNDRGNYDYEWCVTYNAWFDDSEDYNACRYERNTSKKYYRTYEEALLEGIKEAIKILKEEK